MIRLIRWLRGKPSYRRQVVGGWFVASMLEANMKAGQLAYGW